MTLQIYLFRKFLYSIIICGGISYSFFFIFSLIGNLGEKFSFNIILYLSALNSIQIFTFIPSHLFILSFCLFIIGLKSKNELTIIKEYINLKSLFLIISPILFLFVFIEFNKDWASSNIEKIKSNLISSSSLKDTKIFISYDGVKKNYTIFSKFDENKKIANQYLNYQIYNQKINKGELSTNLNLNNNDLYSNETTIFENNNFRNEFSNKKIFKNFTSFLHNGSRIIIENDFNSLKSNYINIQSIIFYSLFYLCISMIFFSKRLASRNINSRNIFILVLFIFLYFLIAPKIILNNFHHYFQIISLIILLLTFFKIKKYE